MKKAIRFGLCLALIGSMLSANLAFGATQEKVPAKKVDEILVQADASGNVKEKTGTITITGSNSKAAIKDITNLTNIKNISGDEKFTQNEDGTITWENSGNEIRYTGELTEELPFSMKVTYYLDEQEIAPADLAGKSGRVKVVYAFENLKMVDVDLEGEKSKTYVPFLAVTTIALPMEGFDNVESLGGGLGVTEFGDQHFLMGVATPGVKEALNLEIMGLDKYVEFPESFGFTADVTNFEMPATVTCVTPHAMDKLNFSQLDTPESVSNKVEELVAATEKLVDGSDQLASGTTELANGMNQFMKEFKSGLQAISDGSAQLNTDLYNLEDKKNELQSKSGELINYLDDLLAKLNAFTLPNANDIFTPELLSAEQKLQEDVKLLIKILETMKSQLEEVMAFADEAQAYIDKMTEIGNAVYAELASIDLDKMVAEAQEIAKKQVCDALKEEFSSLGIPDEQLYSLVDKIMANVDISSVTNEAKGHIANVEAILNDIPSIEIPEFKVDVDEVIHVLEDMEQQFKVLENAIGKQGEIVSLLDSANGFLNSVKSNSSVIKKKSNELISGLDFADGVIKNAHSYMNSLNSAVAKANEGTEQLAGGAQAVDSGAKQLADGTEQYYKEGILTAADYAKQATLQAFLNRCKSFILAAREYTNISGIDKETKGSIRFTVSTEAIRISK